MTRRRLAALALVLLAALAFPGAAAAVDRLGLTEARSSGFPQRAYVLTLPDAQTLPEHQVSVTENGEPVEALKIQSLGGQSAVVLAIDGSRSMGRKIEDAMNAARAFAAKRLPDQRLGIVFFSSQPQVALEPTTDAAAIDAALEEAPKLPKGTQVYDGAAEGVAMIKRSRVAAGSVIVLSDGADYRSAITRNDLVADAKAAHVRLFGVGIASGSFDPATLQSLTVTGGDYVEAAQPEDLSAIYERLADRQGREFLVSYRSRQPLESDVAVAFSVSGIRDVVTAAYRSPDFPVPPSLPDPAPTWWESSTATNTAIATFALLLAFGLWILVRPSRGSMSRRISLFTASGTTTTTEEDTTQKVRELLDAADGRLAKWQPWLNFVLDVELAKLSWTPGRIVLVTSLATFGLSAGFIAVGSRVLGLILLLGIPLGTWMFIRYRATKTRRRFEEQLPDNLQVMASALRAGHSFIGALTVMVKDAPEPSRKEFRRVVQDETLGISVEQSLEVVYDRMRCEDVIYVGLIATLQRDTGGNTAEVLDKVVETMRERGKLRRLVRTLTAQGRLGGWIVTALPVLMVIFLVTLRPGYLRPLTEQTLGWVMLITAALMVALGAYCIRRIVDIKV